jgi:hypothetical protein
MCNFLSAIVLRNGDVLSAPELTDAHSELIEYFGLAEVSNSECSHFAKVEFTPSGALWEADKYALSVDEPTAPIWWDEVKDGVESKLRSQIERMIVRDHRRLLLGGCWIVCGEANVGNAKNGTLKAVSDSARVGSVSGSARVDSVSGSARVGSVLDSARVGSVSGSARVDYVSDSARVDSVSGSARVGSVSGSARVGSVSGSAKIENDMRPKA